MEDQFGCVAAPAVHAIIDYAMITDHHCARVKRQGPSASTCTDLTPPGSCPAASHKCENEAQIVRGGGGQAGDIAAADTREDARVALHLGERERRRQMRKAAERRARCACTYGN
jgi:hypothetical protein